MIYPGAPNSTPCCASTTAPSVSCKPPRLNGEGVSEATPLAAEPLLGAWRVVRLVGRGGMGEVYELECADGRISAESQGQSITDHCRAYGSGLETRLALFILRVCKAAADTTHLVAFSATQPRHNHCSAVTNPTSDNSCGACRCNSIETISTVAGPGCRRHPRVRDGKRKSQPDRPPRSKAPPISSWTKAAVYGCCPHKRLQNRPQESHSFTLNRPASILACSNTRRSPVNEAPGTGPEFPCRDHGHHVTDCLNIQ
jgi:hypothetical protein